jgi:hypothetical protein
MYVCIYRIYIAPFSFQAFSDAYNLVEPPSKGEDYSTPYVLRNHSGMPVTVKLDERFQVGRGQSEARQRSCLLAVCLSLSSWMRGSR